MSKSNRLNLSENHLSLKKSIQSPFIKEHSLRIPSSIKIMIIFNNTSAEIKAKSADVLLNMIIILTEMRIVQLCS